MEEHGYKNFHKFSQFIKTLTSRKTRTINVVPNKVKKFEFLSFLSGKPIGDFNLPKFAIGEKVCISRIESTFRKVINFSLQKKFLR